MAAESLVDYVFIDIYIYNFVAALLYRFNINK